METRPSTYACHVVRYHDHHREAPNFVALEHGSKNVSMTLAPAVCVTECLQWGAVDWLR